MTKPRQKRRSTILVSWRRKNELDLQPVYSKLGFNAYYQSRAVKFKTLFSLKTLGKYSKTMNSPCAIAILSNMSFMFGGTGTSTRGTNLASCDMFISPHRYFRAPSVISAVTNEKPLEDSITIKRALEKDQMACSSDLNSGLSWALRMTGSSDLMIGWSGIEN